MNGDVGPGAGSAAPGGAAATAAPASGNAPAADLDLSPFELASAAFSEGGDGEPGDAGAGEGAPATGGGQPAAPAAGGDQQQPADELAALRAENERLKASAPEPAPAPEIQKIRRFTGVDPIHEGGPTLQQLDDAISRRDYAALNGMKRPDGNAGYTLEEALDLKATLEGNQQLMNDSAGVFHRIAWGAIGGAFDEHAKAVGLDPAALSEEAGKAGDPLGVSKVYLSKIVEAARKSGRDEGAKEWKGKHDGVQAEFSAYKAQAAGGAPRLEDGGRSGGLKGAAAALALADDEFTERAIRGDFAGLDLSE